MLAVRYEEDNEFSLDVDIWKSIMRDPRRSCGIIRPMNTAIRSQQRHSTHSETNKVFSEWERAKPMVSPDYIVGLTDGEGCFYVLTRPPYNRNGGAMVQLRFFIKVRAEDKEMLEKVRNTLGCGSVYFQHEMRVNHAQCYRYTVGSHKDILGKIIPFFQTYPLQSISKTRNFKIFCDVATLILQGVHHTKEGIVQIQKLKSQMNHRTRVVRETRMLRGNTKWV